MDNPGTTLFQGADIKINNSQNNEEEEDLEDQIRRREELQNLLTTELDDFKYDDSTINSSTNVSVVSIDDIKQNYIDTNPNDQLKLLYEVRLREINNLRKEYEQYKAEKAQEVKSLKTKFNLCEAELRQLQISLTNSESLLVEKTDIINKLRETLEGRDAQIKKYEKTIENFKTDVCTYTSTITELELKLQAQNNPFNLNAKFNSQEMQKANQNKILKLESMLEEQRKKETNIEKENLSLQQELQKLISQKNESEKERNETVNALTTTLESAQQQCKDLIMVVEMLGRENEHMKERVKSQEDSILLSHNNSFKIKSLDNVTLQGHVEKLKKMLLDKSIEMDTLKTKLKHYESDVKELIEYRQIKSDVYKKEFKQCDNLSHTKDLLLMQNDLQNYRRTIDDKNQQILNLNSINKELQEKIEEMILQTRNEIQNLSHKYSLPQLQVMNEELKNAEAKVKMLTEKLEESEERRFSLVKKFNKNSEGKEAELMQQLKKANLQIEELRKTLKTEKEKYEISIDNLKIDLEKCEAEVRKLNKENLKLKNDCSDVNLKVESEKQYTEGETIKKEYEQLKDQLNQVMKHLENSKTVKDPPEILHKILANMDEFLTDLRENTPEKNTVEEKIQSWRKQLTDIKLSDHLNDSSSDYKCLKEQYKESVQNLHQLQNKIKEMEETVEELSNAKTIAEGEKCTFKYQWKDCQNQLEQAIRARKQLENEMDHLKKNLQQREETINSLRDKEKTFEVLNTEIENLKKDILNKENDLKLNEDSKKELKDHMEEIKMQLEKCKKENLVLQFEITANNEKAVRRNLEKELQEAESQLEQSRTEESFDKNVMDAEHFKKTLQTELLKNELKLREDLQKEYQKKITDIEKKYQKACSQTNDLYKKQTEKMENQEMRFRDHLAKVLAECGQRFNEMEAEKHELQRQIELLQKEFTIYRDSVAVNEGKYIQMLKNVEMQSMKNVEAWKKWSNQVVGKHLNIESINKKTREKILSKMNTTDAEISAIEKTYNEKITKYLKSKAI